MPESSFTITLKAHQENITPGRLAKLHGCAPGFAESVKKTQKTADGHWGWCTAMLTAEYRVDDEVTHVGTATLGACSYFSAADFIANSGYFDDMVKEAIAELKTKLLADKIAPNLDQLRKMSGAPPE